MIKKRGCKWFNKWKKSLSDKNSKTALLFKNFNIMILDKYEDDIPKEMQVKMSPTFLLVESGEITGEINGFMSAENLLENFVF